MTRFWRLAASLALCAPLYQAAVARADLSDCGQIDVRAEADCTVVPPTAQCQAMCTPVTVQATCSAKLAASCDASCSKVPSIDCEGSCMTGCTGKCMLDPGKFNCKVDCEADCDGQCSASCSSKSDQKSCMASCSGSCSVSCDKQCDVQLPKADCNAQCKASCQGSCTVQPNLDCQIDCQAKGYVKCQADVMGGCMASCKSQKGALFCDGQFIDTGDKLDSCVQSLKDTLNAHVMASSSGSSSCDAGTCMASGMASASTDCTVLQSGVHQSAWPGLAIFGLALAFVVRRRKQQ